MVLLSGSHRGPFEWQEREEEVVLIDAALNKLPEQEEEVELPH